MAVIAEPRARPSKPKHQQAVFVDTALFYSGLVAFMALLVAGTLSAMAVVPMIVPGYMSASITSGSMMPTIHIGDVVIASDHDGTEITPGTVVVYEEPRKHDLVMHRVVSATPEGLYITRGDGVGVEDTTPTAVANIRSKAQWIVPFVGLPRVWAAQRNWTLVMFSFVVTALALWLTQFAFDPRYDPWEEFPGSYQRPLHPSIARSQATHDVST